MSMPTTTDEFEAVLKAFKEQDANGNGDASDEIPFSTDPNNKHIEAMAGYFGLPMNKLGIAIQNEKVVYGGVSDTYREFLSWFHKLYAEGLVDVELYTQDSSTWKVKEIRTCTAFPSHTEATSLPESRLQRKEAISTPCLF